ncbi:type II toxin-antitoxin system VapC family toxin [Pedobacter cryophilus]|uniref:PIN domain-containing protein n=1 Tax=Pedobacter cryophilus TaxID=2571271 RepID=A0A4U1C2Q9_9SPHI|nr:PIN domain-containing protein [Pedobacter cryophilus]TKB98586.1 PIN domain-containing protein [Pedobacter cryophilus]
MAFKIFLDANVILDFVLKRKNYEDVKLIFEQEEKGNIKLFISSSILHIIGYWLTKYLGVDVAKTTLLKLLEHIKVIDSNHEGALDALKSDSKDIEDALQYFTALNHKMDYLISFDIDFQKFANAKLPIVDVKDFIKLVA